ncbi:MAG: HAD-IA family hydrolase [Cellvibrionaceae bacterium]|nr:HAD-IA family hydrolase [Cellvibrionaceae bacterium]
MKKSCLLFDNDGTLVDSEYLCNLAIAQQFAELGVTLDVDDLVRNYRGGKLSEILGSLALRHQVKLRDDAEKNYRQRVAQLFDEQLKPVSGIETALAQLPQVKAVVSNGPRKKIEHALQVCDLRHYFSDRLFSAYDLGLHKPDPHIYLESAKKLGFTPEQCVVIEDSETGVSAGSRAGISTLFYNKFNEALDLPHVTSFTDMRELPALIDALSAE